MKYLLTIYIFFTSCSGKIISVKEVKNDTIQSVFYSDSLLVVKKGKVTTFKYIIKN